MFLIAKIVVSFFLFINVNKCAADYVNCNNKSEVDNYLKEMEAQQAVLFSVYANATKYENLAEMFQEAEAISDLSLTIDNILPENKSSYLKRRPPTICGRPASVIYHVTVMSLDTINEASMVGYF